MKYYLFLDESGDQNLRDFNPIFPIFTLCGIVISENKYAEMCLKVRNFKSKYWGTKKIILHSRDIRKYQNGFELLFDLKIKKQFIEDINSIIQDSEYEIITCSILKEPYIKKYGRLDDVYGKSLSFIMERTVFLLDDYSNGNNEQFELTAIAEKRGKKEDKQLLSFYNRIMDHGTYYVDSNRIKKYFKDFRMKWKREDETGLQISDLIAYPIARHALNPDDVNLAYDILKGKIYQRGEKKYGLKIFPN